ncbi:hypothetical protein Tco_0834954 [Tanacetum coccineum]
MILIILRKKWIYNVRLPMLQLEQEIHQEEKAEAGCKWSMSWIMKSKVECFKSENMDVTTIVTPSNVKTVESNHESAGVKSNGDVVEPKTIRKNSLTSNMMIRTLDDDEVSLEFNLML